MFDPERFLAQLVVVVAATRLVGALAARFGQPRVVGEITAGILLGPSLLGRLAPGLSAWLFPPATFPVLLAVSHLGLLFFMFLVGLHLDLGLLRASGRTAVVTSPVSIVVPLGLGLLVASAIQPRFAPDVDPAAFALFMGVALSVTAFPVLARILTDRGMQRTEVGGLALASAAVDDVVAWSLLAVVVTIGGAAGSWRILFAVPYLVLMFAVVRPLLRRLLVARAKARRLTPDILSIVLIGLLLSCYATEWLGVHAIFGAFVFGVIMPRGDLRHEIMERLEQVSVLLLLPAFFVLAGMRVDLSTVDLGGALELALILAVAVTGKFAGAYLGARLHRVRPARAGALAILMNTRGLTEIVILTVGLQLGLLDTALFSLMVVMALVTTIMAGPLLAWIYPRRTVEKDIALADKAALGVTDAYRVLITQPSEELVAEAMRRIGQRRPAEIVLSRLLPGPVAPLEVGISSELLKVTGAMTELAALAAPIRAAGIAAPVLVRFSGDIPGDFAAQVATADADVVLSGQGPNEVLMDSRGAGNDVIV